MKELGTPIIYDFTVGSYLYKYRVVFYWGFKDLRRLNKINGGIAYRATDNSKIFQMALKT